MNDCKKLILDIWCFKKELIYEINVIQTTTHTHSDILGGRPFRRSVLSRIFYACFLLWEFISHSDSDIHYPEKQTGAGATGSLFFNRLYTDATVADTDIT